MSGNQDPSKVTFSPHKERISMSYASLALIGAGAAALGGGFMTFYSNICQPQIVSAQKEKAEIINVLNSLTLQVSENTKTLNELKNRPTK
jgi:hypothetical protein